MPGPEDHEDDIEKEENSSLDEFEDMVDSQLDDGGDQSEESDE